MRARERLDLQASWIALLVFGLLAQVIPFGAGTVASRPVPLPDPSAAGSVSAVVQTEVVGAPGARTVALTFDDGPDPRWTPEVLGLLARHRAVATFCLVGANADRHPDLVHRIVDAGMRLCNHTQTHDMGLATGSEKALAHEVHGTQIALQEQAGVPVRYFRAPGGYWSDALAGTAAASGMQPLGWSVDSTDWRRPGVDEIVRRVERGVHPGAVILLHDGGGQRDQTVAALARLLPWLADHCYAFGFPTP